MRRAKSNVSAGPLGPRFTAAESERYSRIHRRACDLLAAGVEWFTAVHKATAEVDGDV